MSVRGDIEADGDIYATDFVGDTIGLFFNGVTIRNAKIFTSTIFKYLEVNGSAQIAAPDAPWFVDANLEFKGDVTFRTGTSFELGGANGPFPWTAFHVSNGLVGINTANPLTNLDINGQIAIRDGTQANGYVLRAVDNLGNTRWELLDTDNVAYAANVDNATTANLAGRIANGTITNSDFIGGTINGSTLVNVDFSTTQYASRWVDGPDGLYPVDGATEDVMVGGNTIATSTISMQSNGTFAALRFVGDFSNVTNIPYNQEWNDQGSFLHPLDLAGEEGIIIGGNSVATADTILNPDGSAVFNEQAQNADSRVEGQSEAYLFYTDASADRVSLNVSAPRASFDVNGAVSYFANTSSVDAGIGITAADLDNSRVIYIESTGACNVDIVASPQIAAGQDGQIITLIGRYSDEVITLDDGDGLALSNNISISLAAKDSITLMYSASLGEWLEIQRTSYFERPSDSLNRGTCI